MWRKSAGRCQEGRCSRKESVAASQGFAVFARMQLLSILLGIVGAILVIVGIIPLLGWINWLALAVCLFGVIFGSFGRNRRPGLVINLAVGGVAALRLMLGGGII
jgi:hypothetical protein